MSSLNSIKNNRFTYGEIMEALQIKDYHILEAQINLWINQNKIVPIKNKGKTSFVPSIYVEYKKVNIKPDYSEYEREIRKLHTALNISRYLKNPEQYVTNLTAITALSDYLWKYPDRLKETMSIKERSYDIWKDEKMLETKEGKQICAFNGFNEQYLNYFYAPETFFFIDLRRKSKKDIITAVIIENKDTWYSLGKALKQSEHKELCNVGIDYLIYGEGNKATKKDGIHHFMDDITDLPYQVLYIGDIDVAGVLMLYRCISHNPDIIIYPFTKLYKAMLEHVTLEELKETDDNRGLNYDKQFLDLFSPQEKYVIEKVLAQNKRIPQEILNLPKYKLMVR